MSRSLCGDSFFGTHRACACAGRRQELPLSTSGSPRERGDASQRPQTSPDSSKNGSAGAGDLGLPARIHGSVAGVLRMYRAVSRLFREYRAGHFSYIAAVSRSFAAVSRYFAAVAQAVSRVSRLSRAVSRASRECHTGGCAQLARALVRQSVNIIRHKPDNARQCPTMPDNPTIRQSDNPTIRQYPTTISDNHSAVLRSSMSGNASDIPTNPTNGPTIRQSR